MGRLKAYYINSIDNANGPEQMTAAQLFADLNTNALTEVAEAATSYYDSVRGLTVRQSFYIYPNGNVVCLNAVDGGYSVLNVEGDDLVTFQSRHPAYFRA